MLLFWATLLSPPLTHPNRPDWGGQTADRLIEGGSEKVLDAHWLLTRTTGISTLQMDTQVESQVGRDEGGGRVRWGSVGGGTRSASFVSCLVCVRAHTVTSGPDRRPLICQEEDSAAKLHCTHLDICSTALSDCSCFHTSEEKTPAVLRLSWLVLNALVCSTSTTVIYNLNRFTSIHS